MNESNENYPLLCCLTWLSPRGEQVISGFKDPVYSENVTGT